MKIIVLGGDGFCGWPTALHLSARGHDVVIVDNLSRRKIDVELEVSSLTPIRPLGERVRAWHALLAESLFTPSGTELLRARWGLPPTRTGGERSAYGG